MKLNRIFLILLILGSKPILAQDTLRVLFLGNSYTAANNLPQLVYGLSSAAGKTLVFDSNLPGGMTVADHLSNATSLAKVSQGGWDFVVIQEQSQLPTIDHYRFNVMYPAITQLKALVEQHNPCAKIITYMTWGRQFGGQQCDGANTHCSPVFVDFNHMQDSLTSAYTEISDLLAVQCAPVGVVWQQVLNDTNLVLHTADQSHPNLDGSYLAALSLFNAIWKLPASGLSYTANLPLARATYYQQQADQVVFGRQLDWNLNVNQPSADFSHYNQGLVATFTNASVGPVGVALQYAWDFGDGQTADMANPVHAYAMPGQYPVKLVASNCIFSDTMMYEVQVGASSIAEHPHPTFVVYPNPTSIQLTIDLNGLESTHGLRFIVQNAFGQQVFQSTVLDAIMHVNPAEWGSNGLYLLSLFDTDGNQHGHLKIVLQQP